MNYRSRLKRLRRSIRKPDHSISPVLLIRTMLLSDSERGAGMKWPDCWRVARGIDRGVAVEDLARRLDSAGLETDGLGHFEAEKTAGDAWAGEVGFTTGDY